VLRSRSGKPIGLACSLPDAAFLLRGGEVTIGDVTFAILAQTTSGLPPDLWDPLAPDKGAAGGPSGGVSIAIALVLFAVVLAAGFLVGAYLPLRGRRPPGGRIVVWRSGDMAEFRVVSGRRVIGRSQPFAAPADGPIPDDDAARAAREDLLAHLGELGWQPAGADTDQWYGARLAVPS
jgi:hypothetical protein